MLFIGIHGLLFFVLKKEPIDFIQNKENATLPVYDTNGVTVYFKKWFHYIEDHFPFKNDYISLSNKTRGIILNSFNAKDKVVLGKNNWLYYNACIYDDNGLNEFCGFNKWDTQQLNKVIENLKTLKKWCGKNNINFEVILCPNKQSIYPEYLPNVYEKNSDNRYEQITKALPDIINLKSIFQSEKTKNPKQLLYYKTDTHWNEYGAWFATKALQERLLGSFPFIDDLSYTLKDSLVNHGNDLANMLSLSNNYCDTFCIVKFKNKNPQKINHLVVVSDSFLGSMESSLNQLFTKITTRHLYNDGIPSPQYLLENKTDVFVIELVERYKELLTLNISPDYYN
mgnify:CR=1 FL=1